MLASVDEGPTDPTSPQGLRKSCRPGPAESPNPRPETPRTQGPPRDEGQNAKQPGTPDQRPRGPTDRGDWGAQTPQKTASRKEDRVVSPIGHTDRRANRDDPDNQQ